MNDRRLIARALVASQGRRFRVGPVDLELSAGSRLAVLGPSGSGKSTLLDALAGLAPPVAGERILGAGARRCVLVQQDPGLFEHRSAGANVEIVRREHRGTRSAAELLALVGFRRDPRARPTELSGGERQRLALARALAAEPDVLLLDEPLAHLDRASGNILARALVEALGGKSGALAVAAHDLPAVKAFEPEEVLVLDEGEVLAAVPAAALLAAPRTARIASALGFRTFLEAEPGPGGWRCAAGVFLPEVATHPHPGASILLAWRGDGPDPGPRGDSPRPGQGERDSARIRAPGVPADEQPVLVRDDRHRGQAAR